MTDRRYTVEETGRTRWHRTRWTITTPEGRQFDRLSATEADQRIRGKHPDAHIT